MIDSQGKPGIVGTASGVVLDDDAIVVDAVVEDWAVVESATDELLEIVVLELEFSELSWGSCVHSEVWGGVVRVTLLPASAS
jgi:hypothetical protein